AACAQGPAAEGPDNAGADPETDYQVPIETWSLDNGARVLYVHRPELPMMSLKVAFDAGSARDPAGKFGLSALTARMLDQGAGDLSADELARRVDNLGLRFGAGNGRDQLSVRVTSLTEGDTTAQAWDLVTTVLTEPAFEPVALARERSRLLTAIKRDKEDPQQVAVKAFYRKVYGDHPYAHPSEGEPDGLKAIERSDLEAFAERYFVGRNATIAVVGAMKPKAVKALLAETLGRLPAGEAPAALPEVADLEGPQEVFIEKDVSQAHVLMGQPGTTRDAEDYFPLLVGNYSLGGGGFASRLVGVVREEHGLSYSVFSTFAPLTRRGPFVAGLQTANDNVPKALSLLQGEMADFVREGPTDDEVDAAQRYLTGSFPLKLESNQDLRGQLATMGFYGLGTDYLERYLARVRAVEPGDIATAMAERLDPERMVTVIVGAERPDG
ncbi:MAG: M16 family metallopeptidase, partial [Thiohalorhabdaceae bacterium]